MDRQDPNPSRRTFLKAGVAALVSALAPFRSNADPVTEQVVKDGFVATEHTGQFIYDSYAVERGALVWSYKEPNGEAINSKACLFRGLCFTLKVYEPPFYSQVEDMVKRRHRRPELKGTMMELLGPADDMKFGYETSGDVTKSRYSLMKFGFTRKDNTTLWLPVFNSTLMSIGCSYTAKAEDGKPDFMATTMVDFLGLAHPIYYNDLNGGSYGSLNDIEEFQHRRNISK